MVTVPKAFSAASKAATMSALIVDIGGDGDGAPASAFDLSLERLDAVGAARHQRDRRAVVGERARKLAAEPARGAGHQRDAACEIEQVGGFHAGASPHRP